jgi:methylase of polypeptide subunit release factors
MPTSEPEWDAKHGLAAKDAAEAPSGILIELWPLLPAGAALDLACGRGRNALFLAEHGRHVTAVDWSAVALDILEERAKALKIPVRRIHSFAFGTCNETYSHKFAALCGRVECCSLKRTRKRSWIIAADRGTRRICSTRVNFEELFPN